MYCSLQKRCPEGRKTGCTVFAGGKAGLRPKQGTKILELAEEKQLFSVLEKTFDYYRNEGLEGERLGDLIERLGIERYLDAIGRSPCDGDLS